MCDIVHKRHAWTDTLGRKLTYMETACMAYLKIAGNTTKKFKISYCWSSAKSLLIECSHCMCRVSKRIELCQWDANYTTSQQHTYYNCHYVLPKHFWLKQ